MLYEEKTLKNNNCSNQSLDKSFFPTIIGLIDLTICPRIWGFLALGGTGVHIFLFDPKLFGGGGKNDWKGIKKKGENAYFSPIDKKYAYFPPIDFKYT